MRKGHASFTALVVASARALASSTRSAVIDPRDRLARRLLPGTLGFVLDAARFTPVVRASLGFVDHIALRTAMLDRLLLDAVGRGVKQVVIVGAGLDSRAHRLSGLRDATVFELDHPDSQRLKRERARQLEVAAAALHYVACDLQEFGMAQRMAEAGHRADQPSFFLLEGLVPYLRYAVLEPTLHQLANLAAPGSQIAITYVEPDQPFVKHFRRPLLWSTRALGEPLYTALRPAIMARLLEHEGFAVEHDSETRDWALRLCPPGSRAPLLSYERLVLASRR